MDKVEFENLRLKLEALTPVLTKDVLEMMESHPELKARYGAGLFEVASQGTVAFRDVLLGAVEFRHPRLLANEIIWLDKLLTSRQLNHNNVDQFVTVIRTRLETDLPPAQATVLLSILSNAMQEFKEAQQNS